MRTSMMMLVGVLGACSGSKQDPAVGTWSVDIAASADKRMEGAKDHVTVEGPADEAKMFMDMMKEQLAQQFRDAFSSSKLVIRGDGHYTLSYRAGTEAIDESGTWTDKDKLVTLECATVNGTHDRCPRAKEMRLADGASAKTATLEDPTQILSGTLHPFGNALVVAR